MTAMSAANALRAARRERYRWWKLHPKDVFRPSLRVPRPGEPGQGFYSLESSSATLVSLSPSRAVSKRPGQAYEATQESASSQLHERRMCRFRPETDVDPHQPCPGQRSSIGGSPSSHFHSLSSMNWVDQPAGACGYSRNRSSDITTPSAAAGGTPTGRARCLAPRRLGGMPGRCTWHRRSHPRSRRARWRRR